MPEVLDLTFFAIAIPAVIFAGVSKGGFGSGAAFAATPLLALILEPGAAVGLMLPLLMLMDVTALRPYWGKWDGACARALILGALPGVALGALVYRMVSPDLFRLLIGLVALRATGGGVPAVARAGQDHLSGDHGDHLLGWASGWVSGRTGCCRNAPISP